MTPSHRRHKPGFVRRVFSQAIRLLLSFLYLMLSAFLILFGVIVGWDNNPGQPLIGTLMILAGVAVFILGPRVIRRVTGRDPINPPLYT